MTIGELITEPKEWDDRFIRLLKNEIVNWSKDPEVKVAALIVSKDRRQFSVGYNGFPQGVTDTKDRLKGDERVPLTAHAEFNACMNSTANFQGGTIYTTKAPCVECAKAIVHPRVGLVRCVQPAPDPSSSWHKSCTMAVDMMREVGIKVDFYKVGLPEDIR